MSKNLRSENGDVVTGVRLASNVEVLLSVLRELLEEQGQKSIDVLASGDSVADSAATVGVADVDWLVQENHRGIGVPGVVIVDSLNLAVDGAGTKLHEQSSERRAAGATVQPEDDRVILRVVARLEEPFVEG